MSMKITDITPLKITESKDLFDFETVKFDPDRDDVYDVVSKIMPVLGMIAYKDLVLRKEKHDKIAYPFDDEEDEANNKFDFSEEALADVLDDWIRHLRDKLDDLTTKDQKDLIRSLSRKFPHPLDKK